MVTQDPEEKFQELKTNIDMSKHLEVNKQTEMFSIPETPFTSKSTFISPETPFFLNSTLLKTPNQHQNVTVCTIVRETPLLLQMAENDVEKRDLLFCETRQGPSCNN